MAGRRVRGERSLSPHWEDTLTEVARALRAMGSSSQQRSAREAPEMVAAQEFRRHNPPRFSGEPDLMATEEWLNHIHCTLNMLNMKDDHIRVALATY